MMRMLPNLLSNSKNVTLNPNDAANDNFERTHVEGNIYRYTVTLGERFSTYTQRFLSHLAGQTVTVSLWVRSSVDVGSAYLLRGDRNQSLQKGVWKRLTATFTAEEGLRLSGLIVAGMEVGDYVDVKEEYIVNVGEVPSDIWMPAEEELTSEQIATLPPYGEYKEIKSF